MNTTLKTRLARGLRSIFYGSALGFFTFHAAQIGINARIGDSTADIARRLNLTEESIRAFTGSNVRILNPSNSHAYVFLKYGTVPRALLQDNMPSATTLQAEAWQNPYLGHNSFIDRISGGLSGALMPCIIVFSDASATRPNVFANLTAFSPNLMKNIPGRDEDYVKIILMHELEHCNHINGGTQDRAAWETASDMRALSAYLADGGDADVAKAWAYMRVINGMLFATLGSEEEKDRNPYYMGAMLYDRFVTDINLNPGAADLAQAKSDFLEAGEALLAAGQSQAALAWLMDNPGLTGQFAQRALEDTTRPLSPGARRVLTLYRNGIDFFMTPPDLSIAKDHPARQLSYSQ